MHKRRESCMFFYGLLWMCFIACASHCLGGQISDQAYDWLKQIQAKEDNIAFYGKVIDQHGEAVAGVKVFTSVDKASILPRAPEVVESETDEKGCFLVSSSKGSGLFIKDMQKAGYEVRFEQETTRGFSYRKDRNPRHIPDPARPVVFLMRKKGIAPSFLLQEQHLQLAFEAKESGRTLGYDSVQGESGMLGIAGDSADLYLQASFNADGSKWQVILSASGTNGGIIAGNEWLSEAPENGYQSRFTFAPEDHKLPSNIYFYVRSRDPAIYARYEIEYINANKDFFRLSGKSSTNPYGERNLEPMEGLTYDETKQLVEEIRMAFRQNKRPAKPSLPALIEGREP